MKTASRQQDESACRRMLINGISILERLGIIDFNGHFSARLESGDILINTGSSVRSAITSEEFVIVGPNGETDNNAPPPPKELPLHVSVYQARPDVNAVVHGHPKWSTLLSSAGLDYQVTMAQGALLGNVPQYPSPGSVNNPRFDKPFWQACISVGEKKYGLPSKEALTWRSAFNSR